MQTTRSGRDRVMRARQEEVPLKCFRDYRAVGERASFCTDCLNNLSRHNMRFGLNRLSARPPKDITQHSYLTMNARARQLTNCAHLQIDFILLHIYLHRRTWMDVVHLQRIKPRVITYLVFYIRPIGEISMLCYTNH